MKLFSAMCQIMQRSCNCVALYQKAQSMPEIAKQTLCDFFFTPFQSAIALLGLLGRDFAAKKHATGIFFLANFRRTSPQRKLCDFFFAPLCRFTLLQGRAACRPKASLWKGQIPPARGGLPPKDPLCKGGCQRPALTGGLSLPAAARYGRYALAQARELVLSHFLSWPPKKGKLPFYFFLDKERKERKERRSYRENQRFSLRPFPLQRGRDPFETPRPPDSLLRSARPFLRPFSFLSTTILVKTRNSLTSAKNAYLWTRLCAGALCSATWHNLSRERMHRCATAGMQKPVEHIGTCLNRVSCRAAPGSQRGAPLCRERILKEKP